MAQLDVAPAAPLSERMALHSERGSRFALPKLWLRIEIASMNWPGIYFPTALVPPLLSWRSCMVTIRPAVFYGWWVA